MITQYLEDAQIDFNGDILNYISTSETLTIPASANFPSSSASRYVVELRGNIFVDGSHPITISGYSRKLTPNPAVGEFYIVPYTSSTDESPLAYLVEFNSADAGNSVTIQYFRIGSPITARTFNYQAPTGLIENLLIENSATTITIKAGLKIRVDDTIYIYDSDEVVTPALVTNTYTWGAIGVKTDGTISAFKLSDITTAGYSTGLSVVNNQLNMYYLYENTKGYCECTTASGIFRIIAVFKQVEGFTDATVDTTNGYCACTCNDTTNYTVGMTVSGTGIPSNSYINEVTNATSFRLNIPATATNTNITMTINNNIIYVVPIEKKPYSYIYMTNSAAYTPGSTHTPIPYITIIIDLNTEISGISTARLYTSKLLQTISLVANTGAIRDSVRQAIYIDSQLQYENYSTISAGYIYTTSQISLLRKLSKNQTVQVTLMNASSTPNGNGNATNVYYSYELIGN